MTIKLRWGNTCISPKINISLRSRHMEHMVFLWQLHQFFIGIHPSSYNIRFGERLIFFQIGLFSSVQETHISLRRKTSMVEVGASSTLFLCENWVGFTKEYFLKIEFSSWWQTHFVPNNPIQFSWRLRCMSPKKTTCVRIGSIKHIVFLWKLH
jgi:hypothetical protein